MFAFSVLCCWLEINDNHDDLLFRCIIWRRIHSRIQHLQTRTFRSISDWDFSAWRSSVVCASCRAAAWSWRTGLTCRWNLWRQVLPLSSLWASEPCLYCCNRYWTVSDRASLLHPHASQSFKINLCFNFPKKSIYQRYQQRRRIWLTYVLNKICTTFSSCHFTMKISDWCDRFRCAAS